MEAVLIWREAGAQNRHGVTGQFVWLVPAGIPHAVDWRGTAGLIVLYVEPRFVRDICASEIGRPIIEDYSALARFDPLVWRLTAEFRALCRKPSAPAPALVESAGTLLASHILLYFLPPTRKYRLPSDRLREIIDHIEEHIGESISRTELARIARMSVRTFGDCFKERTGLTPFGYIMQRRTVRAMEMVDAGVYTKTAIAADLGFADQSHMMRRIEALVASTAMRNGGEPNR